MKMKDRISEREYQGRLESLLKHATAAAEVTRDRNQKAESAENEGRTKSSTTASG